MLMYNASDDVPVTAQSIKVEGSIKALNGPSKATSIKVTPQGFYNAYTLSGIMVVDGVVTSNHIKFSGHRGAATNGGWF